MKNILNINKPIIAIIHVGASPGAPLYGGDTDSIIDQAVKEAEEYQRAGVDVIAIENMHDIPYLNGGVGPEVTAMMTAVGKEVRRNVNLPCGIQILAGANIEAMAVAKAANLDFIRAEGFVFAHVADEGIIQASAGELLRYRKKIDAENVLIFTDIKKKHSAHSITADVDIAETASAAKFFLSDGVIITGAATGKSADPMEIESVHTQVDIPVWVGSGVTLENVETYLSVADGLIVGSYFKKDGFWANEVEEERVKIFMDKVRSVRGN